MWSPHSVVVCAQWDTGISRFGVWLRSARAGPVAEEAEEDGSTAAQCTDAPAADEETEEGEEEEDGPLPGQLYHYHIQGEVASWGLCAARLFWRCRKERGSPPLVPSRPTHRDGRRRRADDGVRVWDCI